MQSLIQKAAVALLVIVFGFVGIGQAAPATKAPACPCCQKKALEVSCVPSCCAAPVQEPAPAAPISAESHRVEWQILSTLMAEQMAPCDSTIYVLPASGASFLPFRAVPIFRRDCSYLI